MTIYDAKAGKIAVIPIFQRFVGENAYAHEPEFYNDYHAARKAADEHFKKGYIVLICPVAEILGFIS